MDNARNVPCPFCGLGCDDLALRASDSGFAIEHGACVRSRAGFGQPPSSAKARVNGAEASLDAAVSQAAGLLGEAREPLLTGLATDVAGSRAALRLAQRTQASMDHLHGIGGFQGVLAMQSSGGMSTTMSELRNRAELVLLVGTNGVDVMPRLTERVLEGSQAAFLDGKPREVVVIGPQAPDASDSEQLHWQHIDCPVYDVPYAIGALRCLLEERDLDDAATSDLPMTALAELASRMREVDYGAVVWGPAGLGAHGDLLVEALQTLVQSLNAEKRWGGLALAGNESATTFEEVCLWSTGYPGRIRFRGDDVIYEPRLIDAGRLLSSGTTDCMVWIGGMEGDHLPGKAEVPSIVLTPYPERLDWQPDVLIPIGVPGLDHAGTSVRSDHVVSLPLRSLRDSQQPAAADVLDRILAGLPARETSSC
ncbi:hypothetical protein M0534_03625 [Methylonatrum kenyense]|uniref:hypothetical protein n=1 Tax=Methylonatrum kenyense TaxID=455253 RepID=UPI0020C0033B|nr:hypothetical protein [Methylonatrum kenyense]MCK8515425.1 hypothetical protein [Methylonatrum kenyense]